MKFSAACRDNTRCTPESDSRLEYNVLFYVNYVAIESDETKCSGIALSRCIVITVPISSSHCIAPNVTTIVLSTDCLYSTQTDIRIIAFLLPSLCL